MTHPHILCGTDKLKKYVESSKRTNDYAQDLEIASINFAEKHPDIDYCMIYTTPTTSEIITRKFIVDVSSYGVELSCPERSSVFIHPTATGDFTALVNKNPDSGNQIKKNVQKVFNLLSKNELSPDKAIEMICSIAKDNGIEINQNLEQGMLSVLKQCCPTNHEEYVVVGA